MENNKQDLLNGHKEKYNMKQNISLTEQDLNNIIKESVKQIIKEYANTPDGQRKVGRLYMRKSLNAKTDKDYDDLGYLMKYSMDKQKESNKPEKMKKAFDKGVEKEMDRHFKNM